MIPHATRKEVSRMRLRLAVAADYANLSSDGKINIMGVFHEIGPSGFPVGLSQGFLVLEWEAGPAEIGTQRTVRIAFVDPDGDEKVALVVPLAIPGAQRPGGPILFNQIINVAGTPIERSGEHAYYILADNDEKGRVALYVHEPIQGGEVNE
jgi:hypothetical protein